MSCFPFILFTSLRFFQDETWRMNLKQFCTFIPLEFSLFWCRRLIVLTIYTNLITRLDKTSRDNALLAADARINDNR